MGRCQNHKEINIVKSRLKNKGIYLILIVAVVLGTMLVSAFASDMMITESRFNLDFSKKNIMSGEEFTVSVRLDEDFSSDEDLATIQWELDYDSEILTYVSHEFADGYEDYRSKHFEDKSRVQFSKTSMDATSVEIPAGDVITVTFKAKENLDVDHLDVSFTLKNSFRKHTEAEDTTATTKDEIVVGHTPGEKATCKTAQTCTKCKGVLVEVGDHDMADATCVAPKTCKLCGETSGTATGKHEFAEEYSVDKKATKSTEGSMSKHCLAEGCTAKDSVVAIPKISTESLSSTLYTYDGKTKTPSVTIKDSKENKLVKDTNYTVTYPSSRYKIGKYTVKITYKGKYSGTTNLTYTIGPKNPSTLTAKLYGHDDVELTWNKVTGATGYKVYYKKSTAASYTELGKTTATSYKVPNLADNTKYIFMVYTYQSVGGVNCYNAGKTCEITTKLPLSSCTVKLSATSYTYDGKAKTPTVTVTNSSGTKLTKDTHYTVTYSKNTNAGTATVTIIGKGSYYGTVTKTFTISKQAASKCKASLSSKYYTYNGEVKTPTVTVTNAQGKKLVKDTDYTVKYPSGRKNIGKYTVTITFKGNYTGTTSLAYTIGPKNPSSFKAALYGHDDVQLTWSKVSGATGYKVYYKKSTASSYELLATTTSTSCKATNLADGAKYTFKIHTYKKVSGNNCYNAGKTCELTMLKKVTNVKAAKSSNSVKVSWKDIAGQSGYQISQSAKKDGTTIVATYATTSGTSKTVTATKGKTYYYKVRAYKTEGDKKIYGPWSDAVAYKRN